MGAVDIPSDPSAAGRLSARLELSAAEVQSIADILQHALLLLPQWTEERARLSAYKGAPEQLHVDSALPARAVTSAQFAPKVLLSGPGTLQKGHPKASTRASHAQRQAPASAGSYDGQKRAGAQVAQATPSAWGDARRAEQQDAESDTTAFSESQTPEGGSTQPHQGSAAARNPQPAWPAAQPHQPRGAKGGNTFGRGGNRKFGKGHELASKCFVAPIQITRMEWGEPLPNAQDTWGDEEAVPQPLPSAMPAEGKPSYRRNVQPVTAFPPIAEDMSDAQDTPTSISAHHSFQSAPQKPAVTMHWTRMWTTDSLDHTDDEIRACLHLPSMPDLVDENGGAGWLVSASNNVLNLWACTCIGSPGEPALQLMHSLDTDFFASDLQLDPANNLLMAAARDTKSLTECVALHHLRLSPGIFRLKGRLGLPVGVSGKFAKNSGSVKALQVQSLNSHQGPLAGCCAASHDRTIAVYPSNVTPGEVAKHKAVWKAHGRTITVLHTNPFCQALYSGDEAGTICVWNMSRKPTQPEAEVRHDKAVTGICSIAQRSFVSCSLDGRICVWDLNLGRRPMHSVAAPDHRPILKMAVNRDNLVAFATPSGLYTIDISCRGPVTTVAINEESKSPVRCLAWNTGSTGQTYLYASNGATISVYRASSYEK